MWLYRFVGGEELINGVERWCLWLVGVQPQELKLSPSVLKRVEHVREARLASNKARTQEWAAKPALFSENRQPTTTYLAIPKVSSERRSFIPIDFLPASWVASGSLLVIPSATLYHFGILSSTMHNAWMRSVCGRMKSDYQYSAGIVYNNFPWPDLAVVGANGVRPLSVVDANNGGDGNKGVCHTPLHKAQNVIETAAQAVLDVRAKYMPTPFDSAQGAEPVGERSRTATLADLYDPLTMPPDLVKAHQTLDKAVDAAYGRTNFKTEAERVAFLFERYQQLTAPLVTTEKPAKKKAAKVQP